MTLTEFLTARLDEDAAELTVPGWSPVASPRGEGWGSRGDECLLCDRHMYGGTESSTRDLWEHHYEVTHRKARVLAEVAAKRRMLELHSPVAAEARGGDHGSCRTCGADEGSRRSGPVAEGCETVRLLALPYDSHPDYDGAWAP